MTRWESVSLIATAAVFGVLTWGAQAMAQSPGFAAVAVNGQGAWGASLGQPTAALQVLTRSADAAVIAASS
jgi:hypothetical protein